MTEFRRTIESFREALTAATSVEPPDWRGMLVWEQQRAERQRRRRWKLGAAVACVVTLVGVGTYWAGEMKERKVAQERERRMEILREQLDIEMVMAGLARSAPRALSAAWD